MSDTVIMRASDLLEVLRDWTKGKFVEQITGKGLSTNDFTDALQTKLNGIEAGAEVNDIVVVKVNNTALIPDANRAVNIDLSNYATKADISAVYRAKGDITYAELIALTTAQVGDVYNVTDKQGHNYVCVVAETAGASSWDDIGGTIDLTDYYTKTQTDALLLAKANATDLTAHTGNTDVHVTTSDKSAWNAKYDKPSGGIPKTDLATAVQTSLGLADTALQASDVDSSLSATSENPVQNKVVKAALDDKVDKEAGKGLSTEDYTTAEKTKLGGIEAGAEENVIEEIKVNNTALTPSSKSVNITVPTKTSDLTNDSDFVEDASYVHTDNNYTTTEKNKLSGIEAEANKTIVDSALSSSSENPVQNKVINTALAGKANSSHTHVVADITDLAFMTKSEALAILNSTSSES